MATERTPDTTAMARAMYEALHARENRPRNWDTASEEDAGIEAGRNTWMMLANVAAGVPSVEERVALDAKAAADAAKADKAAEADAAKADAAAETQRRTDERAAGTAAVTSQRAAPTTPPGRAPESAA